MFDHGEHWCDQGHRWAALDDHCLPSSIAIVEASLKTSRRQFDVEGMGDNERKDLIERVRAGEHVELTIEAQTFSQRSGVPNQKFVEFSPRALNQLAQTAPGNPIQRNHQLDGETKGRTVAARLEGDGEERDLFETIKLVKPDAVIGVLDGTDDQFSIGWRPIDPLKSILCTHCKQPALEVGHWPGSKLETKAGDIVTVVWRYTDVKKRETSIVAFPAVADTSIRSVGRTLNHRNDMDTLKKLAAALGCAADLETMLAEIRRGEGMAAQLADARADVAAERTRANNAEAALMGLQAESKLDACKRLMESLREEGRVVDGSKTAAYLARLHDAGDVEGLTAQAEILREQTPTVPTTGRQSTGATNRRSDGQLSAPPMTAGGQVDYAAVALTLPSEIQAHFEADVESGRKTWQAILSTQAGSGYFKAAGYRNPAVT